MSRYLLIDFGSTFTKLTAVDTETRSLLGTAAHFTTVQEDIRIGYRKALAALHQRLGTITFDRIEACSSAAGGLKMAALGLVEEMTVEAARRVCLGAGAKVDLVFSHHLTQADVSAIVEGKIDIILLAGGADGGNSECVLFNARLLAASRIRIPVIYAGNKSCRDEIAAIFSEAGMEYSICENVMPKINQLNIEDARNQIRALFLKKIIVAKGIKTIEEEIDEVVLPTPEAVLRACELLAKGYLHEPGLGDLVAVDIGGATTDMYSICQTTRRSDVILGGLEEPFAKRTVEGDLGLRYSAGGVLKDLTAEDLEGYRRDRGIDLVQETAKRQADVGMVPQTETEQTVDGLIAELCTRKAMSRHCGRMEEVFTPLGMMFHQTGKDLTDVGFVLGIGGPIIHARDPVSILRRTTDSFKQFGELRPRNPRYLLDRDYIMSAMGLLSRIDPELALALMKKHLVELSPNGLAN
jgi:uncharacterized protein (TIGR01319 family)